MFFKSEKKLKNAPPPPPLSNVKRSWQNMELESQKSCGHPNTAAICTLSASSLLSLVNGYQPLTNEKTASRILPVFLLSFMNCLFPYFPPVRLKFCNPPPFLRPWTFIHNGATPIKSCHQKKKIITTNKPVFKISHSLSAKTAKDTASFSQYPLAYLGGGCRWDTHPPPQISAIFEKMLGKRKGKTSKFVIRPLFWANPWIRMTTHKKLCETIPGAFFKARFTKKKLFLILKPSLFKQ